MSEYTLASHQCTLSKSSKHMNDFVLKQSQIPLLFTLYDNRLIHEKFLDQIFENLIENKQMIKYDFQKKVYSIYPIKVYTNPKILNKLRILSSITVICILLKYIRYKELFYENFVFMKMYIKLLSRFLTLQSSVVFLILQKNFHFSKIKVYKIIRFLKLTITSIYSFLTFNYLDYKVILNKKLSITKYKKFYNKEF